MDAPQPYVAEGPGLAAVLSGSGQQPLDLLLLHADAVVRHGDQQIPRRLVPPDGNPQPAHAALGLNAVEDGVFRQGLEGKTGNQVVAVCPVQIWGIQRDRPAVTVALYGKIVLQQGELLFQGDQLLGAFGHAFEQAGEGGDHLGHAGGVLDGGHPLDAVQCIVNKVGADLALQHLVFQGQALLLALNALFHQGGHAPGQLVDAPAHIAQFVVPLNGGIHGEIAPAHLLHLPLEGDDWRGHRAVEQGRHAQAHHQHQQQADQRRPAQQGEGVGHAVVGDDLRQIELMEAQRAGHNAARHAVQRGGVKQGVPAQGVLHVRLRLWKLVRTAQAQKLVPLHPVELPAHDPAKPCALLQGEAPQGVGDQGGGDGQVHPCGVAAVAAGHGAGHRDALQGDAGLEQGIGHDLLPLAHRALPGHAGQPADVVPVQQYGLAGGSAQHDEPGVAAIEEEALDVGGGVHGAELVGDDGVDGVGQSAV